MTKSVNPTQEASAAGAASCSFMQIGDGHWTGTVWYDEGDHEVEIEIHQLASSWRAVKNNRTYTGKTLPEVLRKVLK